MYYYESLIKSVWKTEQKCIEKKNNYEKLYWKTKFSKKLIDENKLKNMPDCGR